MTKVFFDSEFMGLVPDTDLVSIGMVSDNNREFYAEITDYDDSKMDSWLQEHVFDNLLFNDFKEVDEQVGSVRFVKGDREKVGAALMTWINSFGTVELWSDVMHYDMVLFQGLFGGAFGVPSHVDYIGYDIATVMKVYGIDPDINREDFIDTPIEGTKHNALYDAKVIRACFDKLQRNTDKYKIML